MAMTLNGSCNCRAVLFTVQTHTPYPYMRCYCQACRKTAGAGGFAINIMALANSLSVEGREHLAETTIVNDRGTVGEASRSFCQECGTMLWNFAPKWPDQIYPFASAIDTELPVPPSIYHIMQDYKAAWVTPDVRENDALFDRYPDQSIEVWHRTRNLWID
jgi:hypothetical protein